MAIDASTTTLIDTLLHTHAMNNRSAYDAPSTSSTALPFGTASAYNDTFPSPSSSSPLSDYRNRGNARRVAGVSEESLRESVQGKGEAERGGLLEVTAETCYQLSLFKGESDLAQRIRGPFGYSPLCFHI